MIGLICFDRYLCVFFGCCWREMGINAMDVHDWMMAYIREELVSHADDGVNFANRFQNCVLRSMGSRPKFPTWSQCMWLPNGEFRCVTNVFRKRMLAPVDDTTKYNSITQFFVRIGSITCITLFSRSSVNFTHDSTSHSNRLNVLIFFL